MRRAEVIEALNRRVLQTYSRRTTSALRSALPLRRVAVPQLDRLLELNVGKEVRKDSVIIRRAGQAFAAGMPPGHDVLQQLLDATKEIDRAFLARVCDFPVGIVIRYEQIAPVRARRIERLLGATYKILQAWQPESGVRAALLSSHPRGELQNLLLDLLRLYAQETRALSQAVRLPLPLVPLREVISQSLYRVMEDTARRLSLELTHAVHRGQPLAPSLPQGPPTELHAG